MQDATPSRTAMATAFIRALHTRIDDSPPVYDDSLAFDLLPDYQQRFILRLESLAPPWLRRYRQRRDAFTAMRAQVVVRSRYAEDALKEALRTGARRYVVLAAGLDTSAFRISQSEPPFEVLEIDHPATQRWKQGLLEQLSIALPARLAFLPVDFERQSLADVWPVGTGADFISWLGATYYLSHAALTTTLSTLRERTRPGTELVLDYWSEQPATDPGSWLLWGTRIAVAAQQEPMRSFFEPRTMEALAQDCGWRVRANLSAAEQNGRYLEQRSDRLAVPSFAHLLHLQR
jgi:methyltransferase (TIGR00027 family)